MNENRRITFVVTKGEVRVAGDGGSKGEIKAMSAQGLVFVHSADGLDHLRASREEEGTFRTDEKFQNKGLIASRV